ncbi:MAG: Fe-S cluster assembly sulfur transfer protein SufU, partial [Noviherbaspirillum sp.]
MTDLRDLYQEIIFDHYRQPRNFRPLTGANRKAEGFNPLCGDRVTVYLKLENGVIQDVSFEGSGCAISTASASLMTEHLKGRSEQEVETLFQTFHDLVTRDRAGAPELGKLEVLAGVRAFPARVKCATLPWHTLHAALANEGGTVTTE